MDSLAVRLGKATEDLQIEDTPELMTEMTNDVVAECSKEFVYTKEVQKAISRRAALLFHAHLKARVSNG